MYCNTYLSYSLLYSLSHVITIFNFNELSRHLLNDIIAFLGGHVPYIDFNKVLICDPINLYCEIYRLVSFLN